MSRSNPLVEQNTTSRPVGWRNMRIKYVAQVSAINVDKLMVDGEQPVRLCNYIDVYYYDRLMPDLDYMEASATEREVEKFQLRADQVIITKDSEGWDDIGIPALVTDDMPGVLCGYHLAIFTPTPNVLDGGFLAWLCRADVLNDQFKLSANGVTRFGLGQYAMKNAVIAFPNLETQKRIAAFLDEKTAKIDALIAKKRVLLDRLAEKRQAIITQAVTKGLDPVTPMKDSGIDWIGQIPAHWEVLPVRRIAQSVTTGRTPSASVGDFFTNGIVPWFTPGDFHGGIRLATAEKQLIEEAFLEGVALKYPENTVLLVGIGATLGKVGVSVAVSSSNQQVLQGVNPYFVAHSLHAFREEVRISASGNTLPILNQDKIKSILIACPPEKEQREISALIAKYDEQFQTISSKLQGGVDLLNEYRVALITAAVTGQIPGLQ